MKPSTAAQKLGILVRRTGRVPADAISRQELDELRADPPAWLVDLRRNGPFPREVMAQKLGVSNSGLLRGGITEPLNADQIGELLADPPAWLEHERSVQRRVIAENERLKAEKARSGN